MCATERIDLGDGFLLTDGVLTKHGKKLTEDEYSQMRLGRFFCAECQHKFVSKVGDICDSCEKQRAKYEKDNMDDS